MDKRNKLVVFLRWDEEAKVYLATSDDVAGLVTEAGSLDEIRERVLAVAPELMLASGMASHRSTIESDDIAWIERH